MTKHNKKLTPYLFLAPAMLLLLVFFFMPFFQSFLISLQSYQNDLYNPVFVGLDNYKTIFSSPEFWKVVGNTFLYLILAVPTLVVLPLILAILVNQKLRGVKFYRLILYIPVVVSIVVAGIAFKWLYAQDGILNYLLSFIGVDKIAWLTDPNVALFALVLVTIWKGLGYYMVIYLAGLMSIPKSLYEACEIDGANTLQKHLAVTIPHLMPMILLVSIISSISAMKVFVEIYVMTKGGPLNSTKTIVYYIYEKAFEYLDLGVACAGGVALLLFISVFSYVNIKLTKDKNAY